MIQNLRKFISKHSSRHLKGKSDEDANFEELGSEESFAEEANGPIDVLPLPTDVSSKPKLSLPPLTPKPEPIKHFMGLPPLTPNAAESFEETKMGCDNYYQFNSQQEEESFEYDEASVHASEYGYDQEPDYGYGKTASDEIHYGYGDDPNNDEAGQDKSNSNHLGHERRDRRRSLGPDSGKPGSSRRLSIGRASIRRRSSIGSSNHSITAISSQEAPRRSRRHSLGVPGGSSIPRPSFNGNTAKDVAAEQGCLEQHLGKQRVRPRRRYSIGSEKWETHTISCDKSVFVHL